MKLRLTTLAVLVALMGMLLAPLSAAAKPKAGSTGVPVTGSGNFSGVFNISEFVATSDSDIAAVGNILDSAGAVVASNVTMPVDLAATAAANQAAATCQILNLVLGPIDLNLLGLRIQLNRVVLTITGETGPGNLLGNLLCGILGLLNPLGSLLQLLDLLNQLADLLDSLRIGNLAAVAPATIAGTMMVQSFTRQGDQILANGTLAEQQVSAPVNLAQSSGSCEILNLVLGPLDLNLLGLRIQLSQVVLNITAEPGAGNLLGNLLCAIANLLNGPSPLGGLTSLLNRLLRAL